MSYCKTFSYNQGIQARIEAKKAGFNDAILLNSQGEICCATSANILVKRENNWLTPPSNSGCLPGIMRQRGIELNVIKEALIEGTPKDNDEWFLINSLSCRPIHKINKKDLKISDDDQKISEFVKILIFLEKLSSSLFKKLLEYLLKKPHQLVFSI